MTRNNHLRNKKDFDLNKSFAEWQINRANETEKEALRTIHTEPPILYDESEGQDVSHCCETSVNDVSDGWGRCSHCHEMAKVLNTADFD